MSWFGNIVNVYFAPSMTFEAIKDSTWKQGLVPLLVLVLLGLASMGFLQDLMKDIQYDETMKRIEESSRIPEEQKGAVIAQMQERFDNPSMVSKVVGWATVAISNPIRVLFMTVIVLLIGNTIFGGDVRYGRLLVMTSYVYMLSILEMAVKTPLMLSKWSVDVYTGLGLLGIGEQGGFLHSFLAGFDIFALWRIILIAIGMGILYEKETKTFLWALLGYWILQISIIAGIQGAF
jgi:hypothetical protein